MAPMGDNPRCLSLDQRCLVPPSDRGLVHFHKAVVDDPPVPDVVMEHRLKLAVDPDKGVLAPFAVADYQQWRLCG